MGNYAPPPPKMYLRTSSWGKKKGQMREKGRKGKHKRKIGSKYVKMYAKGSKKRWKGSLKVLSKEN